MSLKGRFFQNPFTWTRPGCLLTFSSPSWTPSPGASSWRGAGWNLLLGGFSGNHAHFAFNAQNWELSPIAETVEVGGWINQIILLLPGSVGTSLWSDTIKCSENPSTPGQSGGTRPVSLLLHATSRMFQVLHRQAPPR